MDGIQVHKVKHRGYLVIGNKEVGKVEIPCAVLENEKRIVSQTGVYAAFKRPLRSEKGNTGIPYIMEARNLQPFVTEELLAVTKPIHYYHYNGKVSLGYTAEFLPQLCKLYIRANEEGKLSKTQKKFLTQAKMIIGHLPKKDINLLVDEETGYEYSKEKEWFSTNLKNSINKGYLLWQQDFPRDFYQHIFRLHDWPYDPFSLKKPEILILAQFLNDYLYFQLPEEVKKELKAEAPTMAGKIRPKKPSKTKTKDLENPYLNRFLIQLITVMELSDSMDQFKVNFDRVFKKVYQLTLF